MEWLLLGIGMSLPTGFFIVTVLEVFIRKIEERKKRWIARVIVYPLFCLFATLLDLLIFCFLEYPFVVTFS